MTTQTEENLDIVAYDECYKASLRNFIAHASGMQLWVLLNTWLGV